jgi:predicted nucleotidyltransferase
MVSTTGERRLFVNERAYEEADDMAASFAERLAAILGDRLIGVYLVGSYVLGDLQDDSDVDFVAVVDGGVSQAMVGQLESLHSWMGSKYPRRSFEGFYVDAADVRRHPDPASKRGWHFLGGALREISEVRLAEWEMLRRSGRVVAGRPVDELGVFDASADLAAFSHRNLQEYWAPWLRRTGRLLMRGPAVGPRRKQMAWAAAWCALGVPRLHVAIADGKIVSKTEAGERVRAWADSEWWPVIDAALDYRHSGTKNVKQLLAVRDQALAFSAHVLQVALALPC